MIYLHTTVGTLTDVTLTLDLQVEIQLMDSVRSKTMSTMTLLSDFSLLLLHCSFS